jgi:hypothetical protein
MGCRRARAREGRERLGHDLLPGLLVTERRRRLDELHEQIEHLVLGRGDSICDLAVGDS